MHTLRVSGGMASWVVRHGQMQQRFDFKPAGERVLPYPLSGPTFRNRTGFRSWQRASRSSCQTEHGWSTDARPRWSDLWFCKLFVMIKKPGKTDCPQQDPHDNKRQ